MSSSSSSGGGMPVLTCYKPGRAVPAVRTPPCACNQCGCGPAAGMPLEKSTRSIRYSTGELALELSGHAAMGFGTPWTNTRTFSNRLVDGNGGAPMSEEGGAGWNWQIDSWPYLVRVYNTQGKVASLAVMGRNDRVLYFDFEGDEWVPQLGIQEKLEYDADCWVFHLISPDGSVTEFASFDTIEAGRMIRHVDGGGTIIGVTKFHDNGRNFDEVQRQAENQTESVLYGYSGGEPGNPESDGLWRVVNTVLRRKTGTGDWVNVQSTSYGHYGAGTIPGDQYGEIGDLKTINTSVWNPEAEEWSDPCTSYVRYYKSGQGTGGQHLIKYLLMPASYERLKADPNVMNPFTATETQVAQYADYYFEYHSPRQVKREARDGGSKIYDYDYFTSSHPDNVNHWKTKTVETLPGGDQNIIYANYVGQVILKVLKSGSNQWCEFYKYDSNFKVVLSAQPSAITGYDEAYADLLNGASGNYQYMADGDGLVHVFTWHGPSGQMASHGIKKGETGSTIKLWEREFGSYAPPSSSSSSSAGSAPGGYTFECKLSIGGVFPLSKETVYPDDVDQTKKIETTFAYLWHTNSARMLQKTTTLPVVATSQNGSGTADTIVERFDLYGNRTWLKNERGFLSRFQSDLATGQVIQQITDVNTALVGDVPTGWSTPTGGGLHLVTDIEIDALGRPRQVLGPPHVVDLGGTATTVRHASWTVYKDCNLETRSGEGYATGTAPNYTYTLINPVRITKTDKGGMVLEEISAVRASTSGKLTAADLFDFPDYVRWTTHQYTECCKVVSTRVYHAIPPLGGTGQEGVNYNETGFGYDVRGRRNRVTTPGKTLTKTNFDPRDLPTQTLVGTSEGNLVVVADMEYDLGLAGGDGNLTKRTDHVDGSTTRVTLFGFDWRNRRTSVDGEIDFYAKSAFDNLDRSIRSERFNTTAAGNLTSRSESKYDDRGRVFRSIQYAVDPSTGTVGNALTSDFWFDASGNQAKSLPAGSKLFAKSVYDGADRAIKEYLGYDASESSYADALTVTGDTIFEQSETVYDAASNVIQTTLRRRFHHSTGTGELQPPDGTQPKSRVSYAAFWPDPIGRTVASANYGTNGGASFTRPSTIPARSDTVLVSSTIFNSAGDAWETIDPAGTVTAACFDHAGRRTRRIENCNNHVCPTLGVGSSSSSSSSSASSAPSGFNEDVNRTTDWTYTPDNQVETLTVQNASTGDQKTRFVWGVSLADSDIASSLYLRAVIYPDSDDTHSPLGNGPDGIFDRVEFRVNRQGEVREAKDQNETIHAFDFDKLGRRTQDRVIQLGTGIDGAVRRISATYEVRGLVEKITCHDNATVGSGSVVNEILRQYNTFSQLFAEYQEHGGAVNTATSPKVQYAFASGAANHVRPTAMIYPNGRQLNYDFGSSGGQGDNLSRLASLIDSNGTLHLADYAYLGLGVIVQADYTEPDIRFDLAHGSGNDPYDGLDRFDRIVDFLWRNYGTSTDVERIKHGYDRASNRLWRENPVAKAQSPAVYQDELYAYDGLYQLKRMDRGQLNASKDAIVSGTKTFSQDWIFDSSGNWKVFKEDSNGDGTWDLDQLRSHNKFNEITGLSGGGWASCQHDRAGNMTQFPKPGSPSTALVATWDAWNQMIRISSAGQTVAEYAHDGLKRRIATKRYSSGVFHDTLHSFFTVQWQEIENRIDSSSSPARQYVWGARYIDDLVLRDRDANADGSLEERLYALQDAHFNVGAVVNASGAVQERIRYLAYGLPTFLNGSFAQPSAQSATAFDVLFAGGFHESATGIFDSRHRRHHPVLGRWLSVDPQPPTNEPLVFLFLSNSPTRFTDPNGTSLFPLYCLAAVVIIGVAIFTGCSSTPAPAAPAPCGRFKLKRDSVSGSFSDILAGQKWGFRVTFDATGCNCAGVIKMVQCKSWVGLFGAVPEFDAKRRKEGDETLFPEYEGYRVSQNPPYFVDAPHGKTRSDEFISVTCAVCEVAKGNETILGCINFHWRPYATGQQVQAPDAETFWTVEPSEEHGFPGADTELIVPSAQPGPIWQECVEHWQNPIVGS